MKTKTVIWIIVVTLLVILASGAIYIFVIRDNEMTTEQIDEAIAKFKPVVVVNTYNTELGEDYLGNDVKEYIEIVENHKVPVSIKKDEVKGAGLRIAILVAPDFLGNQIYYFNSFGNLMMYEAESAGVGGSVYYYFSNGKLLDRQNKLHGGVQTEFEDEQDILKRADKVYNTFATADLSK